MVKCNICSEKIKELFLGKLQGTVVKKVGKSKPYYICDLCQKKYKTKAEILEKL